MSCSPVHRGDRIVGLSFWTFPFIRTPTVVAQKRKRATRLAASPPSPLCCASGVHRVVLIGPSAPPTSRARCADRVEAAHRPRIKLVNRKSATEGRPVFPLLAMLQEGGNCRTKPAPSICSHGSEEALHSLVELKRVRLVTSHKSRSKSVCTRAAAPRGIRTPIPKICTSEFHGLGRSIPSSRISIYTIPPQTKPCHFRDRALPTSLPSAARMILAPCK